MPNCALVKYETGTVSLWLRNTPPRISLTIDEPKDVHVAQRERALIGLLFDFEPGQRIAVGQRIDARLVGEEELRREAVGAAQPGDRR